MVGGIIIDSAICNVCKPPRQYLWVMGHGDEMQISVALADERPMIGDSIWWQGQNAYWTPGDRRFADRRLGRLGYSHSPKPNVFHCADRVAAKPTVSEFQRPIIESNACHRAVGIALTVAVLVGTGSLVLWVFA